jgi:hypothetical protein
MKIRLHAWLPAAAGAICAMAALVPSAAARTLYVAPNGHDRNNGTSPATALRTIQTAVNRLRPGETLILAPGEYLQQFVVRQSGTAGQPITIRAAVPGYSVLRGSVRVDGFTKVEGTRFTYARRMPEAVHRVIELDSKTIHLEAPALADMDQFRRSFLHDATSGMLYVHTSDGASADEHALAASILSGNGIAVTGSHVHIEGLVVRDFCPDGRQSAGRGFGIRLEGSNHQIRNCTLLYNGGGISVHAENIIIRNNLLIGNIDPYHGETGQIYAGHRSSDVQVMNNTVLDSPTHGIRFYEGSRNGQAVGNIVRNAHIGLYYKASTGRRSATQNVVVGCSAWNFHTGEGSDPLYEDRNTFQHRSEWNRANQGQPGPRTLVWDSDEDDPGFADPVHLDYRLQADSPYRNAAPDGSALGAHDYEPNVFFVGPNGDDAAHDGLSVAQAFRTLARAMDHAGAGVTIYLLPGHYEGTFRIDRSGEPGSPLVIRGRGEQMAASVDSLDLTGTAHVRVENLRVGGSAVIREARDIEIKRCMFYDGDGIEIDDSLLVWVRRSTVWSAQGPAIRIGDACRAIGITSNILHSKTATALHSDVGRQNELFFQYNNYLPAPDQPLVRIAGTRIDTLAQLHATLGVEPSSMSADPRLVDPARTPEIHPGSPCAGAGEQGYAIGAGNAQPIERPATIEEITLRDATPTTLSLTWWTPQTSSASWRDPLGWYATIPVTSEIHYGTSKDNLDQVTYSVGDLYHRVILHNLSPGTTYHFKIVIPEQPRADSLYHPYGPHPNAPRQEPAESTVFSHATPATDAWRPLRRNLYVSPQGQASTSGLDRSAATSLTNVSEIVRAGDTVILLDGVYTEMFAPAATGTAEAPITLKAENLNGAILDGSDYVRPSGIALFYNSHITIDGVVLRRFSVGPHASRAGLNNGQIYLSRTGSIMLSNCVLAGWGGYGLGIIGRGPESLRVENCVFTGFVAALVSRQSDQIHLLGNTLHLPQIRNMSVSGRLVLKNNLFFSQHPQKTHGYVPMAGWHKPEVSDYNAYYYGHGKTTRYLGFGIRRGNEQDMGGVARVREELGLDLHSLEPPLEHVRFTGPVPLDFDNRNVLDPFRLQIRNGQLVPTLAMFDLPAGSPLNTAGENGAPIGARPARR